MDNVFFREFLMISTWQTVAFIAVLFALFFVMKQIEKRKVNFSKRMIISTVLGLILGVVIQAVSGFAQNPLEITYVAETTTWYGLFGNGFVDLIRMLVVPLISVSIIYVIINMKEGANLGKLTRNTLIAMVSMVVVSTLVGLAVGMLFNLGSGIAIEGGTAEIREVSNIVDTIRGLLPANPIGAMVETNIVAIVIFSMFFGLGTRRMSKKYGEIVKPFADLINALQKIIMSIAMTIIKWMPYAVIALLATVIAQRGLSSILAVGNFVIATYIAIAIMYVIQLIVLSLFGYNPLIYVRKVVPVMVLAFTSRSSVGTLPLTVETLTEKMGVNEGTASFVAGFGTTAGMQGCAGLFPALLLVFVANMTGIPIDAAFIGMAIVVITLSSFGTAGIPGAATISASAALAGMGYASLFPLASPVFAVDPIIDMGRTMLNVTGATVNAMVVDKTLGQVDMDTFKRTQN